MYVCITGNNTANAHLAIISLFQLATPYEKHSYQIAIL